MNYHCIISGKPKINSPFSPFSIFKGVDRNRRLDLIVLLHKGEEPFKLKHDKKIISDDLKILETAGLIKKKGQSILPSFFVVLQEEMDQIQEIAGEVAKEFFVPIFDWFSEIRVLFKSLSISKKFRWEQLGFLVIGSFLLHQNPERITPLKKISSNPKPQNRKGGDYYFQLIQTRNPDLLGKYKERGEQLGKYFCGLFGSSKAEIDASSLPFGLFPLFRQMGPARGKALGIEAIEAYQDFYFSGEKPPEDIIPFLENLLLLDSQKNPQVPILTRKDNEQLSLMGKKVGKEIGRNFALYSSSLLNAFYSLPASKYSSFEDFYYWFHYLIADKCLELMLEKRLIFLPGLGYQPYIISQVSE